MPSGVLVVAASVKKVNGAWQAEPIHSRKAQPHESVRIVGSRSHAQLWVFDGLDEALVHLTEVDGQAFTRELLRDGELHHLHFEDVPANPPREIQGQPHRVYPGEGIAPLRRMLERGLPMGLGTEQLQAQVEQLLGGVLRPDGQAVFLDFGLSCHAHFPDLLAEEMRKAVGSPIWIAPEQVVGVRGDPRSDVFAIGVMLYQLATGETPFGEPATQGGMRQRLWMDPVPPRKRRPELPEWLQEIILRCLEPEAEQRYASASLLAFDLANPDQVSVTARGRRTEGTGFWTHFKRWVKAAGKQYQPSPLPSRRIEEVPIVMVALPHHDVTDATLYSLREAVGRSLGLRPGARLACVTVISSGDTSSTDSERSETTVHRQHITRMRQWAEPLDLSQHQASFHVLESGDVADALLQYAHSNNVNMVILGAATHGLQMQRFVATVPIKVAMGAPCTVILVKQSLPFEALAE